MSQNPGTVDATGDIATEGKQDEILAEVSKVGRVFSTVNSTSTPLGAGGVFTGDWEDLSDYQEITVSFRGDVDSDGTLDVQFSTDGVNQASEIPAINVVDVSTQAPIPLRATTKYFRVIYTNGTTPHTTFEIQTAYHYGAAKPLTSILEDPIENSNPVSLVKAVITGENPAGTFTNVLTTNEGLLRIALESPNTNFGDLRVGELSPQFQGSFEYTVDNTDINTNITTNGGTVTQSQALGIVSTSTTTGSTAKLLSKRHAKYRPGLGGLLRFTAIFDEPVTATEQYIGLMSEGGSTEAFRDGYAIGYNGTTMSILRWQDDVLFDVPQSSWDDPLDGTGKSALNINFERLNVFAIGFQYLGGGAVSFLIEDPNTGKFIRFHVIDYANQNTTPSVHNPNFQFTMWVDNKATTSNLSLSSASYAFFVEGKTELIELHQPQNSSGTIEKTAVTTETAIFTIRNKSTYAGKSNFLDIILENASASIEAAANNNLGDIRLVRNATLGGTPVYTDINTTDSIMEIDTAGTTVTGGKEIISIPLSGKNDKVIQDILNLKIILAPNETITLAGSSANSATIRGSILWKELF